MRPIVGSFGAALLPERIPKFEKGAIFHLQTLAPEGVEKEFKMEFRIVKMEFKMVMMSDDE